MQIMSASLHHWNSHFLRMHLFPRYQSRCHRRSPRAMVAAGVIWGLCQSLAIAQVAEEKITLSNQAEVTYQTSDNIPINASTNRIQVDVKLRPVDPFGRIVGCDGELLEDYRGYLVALYEARGALQTDLGPLLALDTFNGTIPVVPGVFNVNTRNENPFDLGETEALAQAQGNPDLRGQYNFLLRPDQIEVGDVYILVIRPPQGQFIDERRIQIRITNFSSSSFTYVANALDGLPLNVESSVPISEEVIVPRAESNAVIVFTTAVTPVCQNQAIRIQKTADRVTAEPGGFVIYRLTLTNLSTANLKNVEVSDRLPLGFTLLEDSVQAVIGDRPVSLTTINNGRDITFKFQEELPGAEPPSDNPLAKIVYATEVTPDALRGDGRNTALASGGRTDNSFFVSDGPAVFRVNITEGLLSDLGTLIGRVFVDKNFDGEQQYGEPGMPNAVVFMENGNRIVTDKDGLFSVANVRPGWHTGVLDLTSVPGYDLAPNPYVLRSETQSRAVRLEPGGMARLNFAITPVAEQQPPQDPEQSRSGGGQE